MIQEEKLKLMRVNNALRVVRSGWLKRKISFLGKE